VPARKAFNQSIGSDGTGGIWQETDQLANGWYESVYANMPRFGLAVGTCRIEVSRHASRGKTASKSSENLSAQ
jgi:hypothetical protein